MLFVSGVYVAAYDMKMEWLVVKGISGFADGTECALDSWTRFASVMAASVVNNILFDSVVFWGWPNFKGTSRTSLTINWVLKIGAMTENALTMQAFHWDIRNKEKSMLTCWSSFFAEIDAV